MPKNKEDKVTEVAEKEVKETEDKVTEVAEKEVKETEDKVTEVAEKEVEETEAKNEVTKPEMVEVNYIKPRGEKSKHISVSLNGKDYIVPWNKPVKIPVGVKEIIDRSFAAMDYAEAYEDSIAIEDD